MTGASSGIGKATAIEFARTASPDPIKIIVSARRLNALEELKKAIEEKYTNAKVYPVKLDVSHSDEIRNFVQNLPKEVQEIDILVNNAYAHDESFSIDVSGLVKGIDKVGEIPEEDIKVMFDTNVYGLINVPPTFLHIAF